MPKKPPNDEIPSIHATIARIGTKLATSGRNTRAREQAVLKFGPNWGNQWGAVPADIVGVVKEAREALFGKSTRYEGVPGVAYAPQFSSKEEPLSFRTVQFANVDDADEDLPRVRLDQPRDTRVVHDFWAEFSPRLDPTKDWALLAGHLQHLYVELVTTVLAGEDPRPTLLKMIAMEPAVQAVDLATTQAQQATVPYVHDRSYIVMENWNRDPNKAVQQIREFLKAHASTKCTVTSDPNGGYTVKPSGLPAIPVATDEYLAVERQTGEIVTFSSDESIGRHQ